MQSDDFNRDRVRRAQRRLVTGGIALLAALVLIAFGIVMVIFPVFEAVLQSVIAVAAFALGIAFLLVGVFFIGRGLATPTTDTIGARLIQVLNTALDSQYMLLRDLTRPGLGAHVDAILIGPNGLVALKLVDDPGIFRCEGDFWMARDPGKDFQLWDRNPTREILEELDHLRAYLTKRDLLTVPLSAMIVFTYPYVEVSARAPAIPVTTLFNLPAELRHGYLLTEPLNENMLKRARRALAGRR